MNITITDADRRIDWHLRVELYRDDSGRYVEPNVVYVVGLSVDHEDGWCEYRPMMIEQPCDEKFRLKYRDEIDAAVRLVIGEVAA